MIYANIELIIRKGEVIANNTLCLYRGDKNVEVRFILKDNHFVIQQNTFAQLLIKRPNANSIFSDISQIQDNTVVFLITGDMINELNETGYYDIQIRLFDDNLNARATLPPVMSALEIRSPLIDDSVVGVATVGYATVMASDEEDTFLEDGSYNATNWADGDIISAEKLNKVEDALSVINDKVPSIEGLATEEYVNQEIDKIDVTEQLTDYAKKSELPTKISQLTNDSNFLTSVPSEYVTDSELTSKGYATTSYVDDAVESVDVTSQLSDYAKKSELHSHSNKSVLDGITSDKITSWDNKSTFDGNYNSLTNKPTIPTVPTNISAFTNDTGYLTSVPSEYIDETDLQAHTDQVLSAGEQLVLNGSQVLQNNYNFSQLTYDGTVANNSAGSLLGGIGKRQDIISDHFFTINPNKPIYASIDVKGAVGSRMYAFVDFYDVDKQRISANTVMYQPNTLTRLTQDLKAGDTVVHFEDLTNWRDDLITTSAKSFIFWNWTNSKGYTYPPETYSRNAFANIYTGSSSVDKVNKTITLTTAWSKGTIPAGTYVSQGNNGNNYRYMKGSSLEVTTEWKTINYVYEGVDDTGQNIQSKFPPGTAFAKFGMFLNHNGVADEKVWVTNITVKEDIYSTQHTHSNKSVLDGITSAKISAWDNKLSSVPSEYVTDSELTTKGYATTDYVNQEIQTIELTPGPQGEQGLQGPKGDKGETGPQGPKGDTGDSVSVAVSPTEPTDSNVVVWIDEDDEEIELLTTDDLEEVADYIATKVPYVKTAEHPICVNSVDEMADTTKMYVLNSTGTFYAYQKKETTTEGSTIPNFTNLLEVEGARTLPGKRYSLSSHAWVDFPSGVPGVGYVIPIPKGQLTIRIKNFTYAGYVYFYLGETNDYFTQNADSMNTNEMNSVDKEITLYYNNTQFNYATFCSKEGYVEIITINEEITYTTVEGSTQVSYAWEDTGISYNQPADYENRVVLLENKTGELEEETQILADKINNLSLSSNITSVDTVFSIPAYPPVPQLPADGSEGSDFSVYEMTTQKAYDYMDALCNKHTQYITKQTMGKDASGTFDHNRYILSKSYWRAWQKENYPKMFAWQNGNTIIYSVSVSPRIGDNMYTTQYIGTVYAKVTSVNCTGGVLSTRTVNGLIFTRYEEGDVEPTIVYTKPPSGPTSFVGQSVLDSSFSSETTVSSLNGSSFVGTDGITYTRYPFEDRKVDKSKPLSIFILANEHGYKGDDLIPSMTVMRIAKDLCKNTDNPFLKWMKENCMITMIPVGSPWGYARYLENDGSGYYNYNGVNINRNYDTPGWASSDTNYGDVDTFGSYAGSENETQHIMNTMRLCKPNVGISCHSPGFGSEFRDMPDNAYFIHQGQGYDTDRIKNIAETLYGNYGMGCSGSNQYDVAQHYNNCGKSPAYIQYVGAVGGLIEIVPQENNTNNTHTSIAMEQSYAQILLFLQTWCQEALEK